MPKILCVMCCSAFDCILCTLVLTYVLHTMPEQAYGCDSADDDGKGDGGDDDDNSDDVVDVERSAPRRSTLDV